MFTFEAYSPTRIILGQGYINKTVQYVKSIGDKALLVTGKKSMKLSGYTDRVLQNLKTYDVQTELFDQVEPNPTRSIIKDGAELAKNLKVDVVIGLGSGSAMDTAKCIAVLCKNDGDIWEFINGREISSNVVPIVCIPSTAGTGSEVTKYAVVSDNQTKLKEGFTSDFIIPSIAIIDPELMSTVPPDLTAKAGGDALSQAIEAYGLFLNYFPFFDLIKLHIFLFVDKIS